MLFTELKDFDFEKEKIGAIEISSTADTLFDGEKDIRILKETSKPLNGKYLFLDYDEIYYYKNGKIHRDDNLPAVIENEGNIFYYFNNKQHRIDGPGEIQGNNRLYSWYINGYKIDNEIMKHWLNENNIPLNWNTWSELDKFYFAMHWSDYNGK